MNPERSFDRWATELDAHLIASIIELEDRLDEFVYGTPPPLNVDGLNIDGRSGWPPNLVAGRSVAPVVATRPAAPDTVGSTPRPT